MGLHEGRVALVTGAGGGIGRAAALIFAREGARVAVADRAADLAKETVSHIESAGADAMAVQVDVADREQVARMVAQVVSAFGRLDSAFNNAGISNRNMPFHELTPESWNTMIGINLTGVFWCMQEEIRQMLAQDPIGDRRGALVNTSSGAGIVPAPGQPHYTAAKHGVLGLTKCAAAEYALQGIRCNSVLPGLTDTPMLQESFRQNPPEYRKMLERTVPGGRLASPEEVGELAVWLCSDQASRVSGQGIVVDGGGVFH